MFLVLLVRFANGLQPISVDFAPNFTTPALSNPDVYDDYFEFHCTWKPLSVDGQQGFSVKFLFDGEEEVNQVTSKRKGDTYYASLHERHLHGKLGKWVHI